jgi:hypothetical protein
LEAGFFGRGLDFGGWILLRLDFRSEGWILEAGFVGGWIFLARAGFWRLDFIEGWIFSVRGGFWRLDILEAGFLEAGFWRLDFRDLDFGGGGGFS